MRPRESIASDWVSDEFDNLLSRLSSTGDKEKCKYLLEVLDSLWDDYFADKVTGFYFSSTGERKLFDSSFTRTLRDVQWLASSMDNELHCPRELFHDCDAVRSIFGDNAPYAIPKVRSKKLLTALGLKTQVTVDDTLAILKVWRAKLPLSASLSQMSKFYTFIWSRMNTSERKVVEELCNGPFVFVPCKLVASHEDVVPGVLLSSKEVFWRDLTGSTDQVKMVCPEFDPHSVQHPYTKMLCSVYPSLHDFLVKECGVDEFPHFHGYLQILLQLSAAALPSQAAKNVFQIFLKWVDELNSGSLSSEDIGFLKEGLLTKDYLVLPTAEDKWVSLNPSFGLICWCDDDKLRTEFEYFDSIKFLYFGQLNDREKEILQTKVSMFLRKLNIPSLSEVVTREAIYDSPTDSSLVASMINWVLPYAQRYIYNIHPDKYLQLSQSGFQNLRCLQVVVVEKLFYRNVIKSSHIESKKRFDCSCLLEGKILHTTRESDSHSIFMEISRLFYSRAPDLHLANFLHMITTMAKSGSTEEQIEIFILNSQKMPKLPVGESVWSLAHIPLSTDSVTWLMTSCAFRTIGETNALNFKKKPGGSSNCPPRKTDRGVHDDSRASVIKTQARKKETIEEVVEETSDLAPTTQITCVPNDAVAPAACKTNHGFLGSRASANEKQAACGILPRKEETTVEVIEETSALVPTAITCVRDDPAPPADYKTNHGFLGSRASANETQAAGGILSRKEETIEEVIETSALAPTDHGFHGSHASVMKTQATSGIQPRKENTVEEVIAETSVLASTNIPHSRNDPAPAAALLSSQDTNHVCNLLVSSTVNAASCSPCNVTVPQDLNYSSFDMRERGGQPSIGTGNYPQQAMLTGRFSDHVHNNVTTPQDLNYNSFDARKRVQLSFGTGDPQQALLTGRLGESVAFKYFVGKLGEPFVKWVNETYETGLPYDLLVAGNEYVEVKATR
ncbi:protein NO VEIN-like [Lycium ferocissimum]|uniref:protein NO VEIN-like n=1 Tax=Lycium ferocissimum TaxID=112874 RepID=UPI0028163399|nr:protein NO VEIN-like [Lycium ferocissimum]